MQLPSSRNSSPARRLTVPWVGKFLKSDVLTQRANGTPNKAVSVTRAKHVLRMMLAWAHDQGHLDRVPVPRSMRHARRQAATPAPLPEQLPARGERR